MSLTKHLPSVASTPSRPSRLDAWLLARLAARLEPARLRYALGDVCRGPEDAVATLRFHDRRSLMGLVLDPEVHFGDAYTEGRIRVEGDLVAALETAYGALQGSRTGALAWLTLLQRHTLARSRSNVHRHYDLGNDFYTQWLDRDLVYTCAYFEDPGASLEEAQESKLDYVCRKLALRPGERVVEAGCGWGALARHMARRYGVHVTACNVSREQVALARRRAAEEGLEDRVLFLEADYRELRGRFDAFVSVGMLEHVGLRGYGELARVIDRCLDPRRGRGLLHFIGRDRGRPLNAWIRRRIFPGAYAPTLDQVVRQVLQPAGLSLLDAENLRRHYALTLDHWRRRFERAEGEGRIRFEERFRRAWRLYLAGSQAAFRVGSLQLFQVTFARTGDDATPWTRASLYRTGDAPEVDGPR
ncbi:MAG TPA: cyclopropane-fatty-acyl-phospholipid synthase family protein [Vicinamibacteria bacterium]|jgi:cyclopropane-fatty-acyl-phospholipid synthase